MKSRTFSRWSAVSWRYGVLAVLCLPLGEAGAGITHWTGGIGDGEWTTAGNWNLGVPAITNNTYIGSASPGINNAAVTLSGGAQESWQIYIGHAAGKTGTVTMTGGMLTPKATASPNLFVGNSGNGTFIQNGGVVSNLNAGSYYLSIGHVAGSQGRYELNGGMLKGFSHLAVGYNGTGTFVQEAGSTNSILYLMMPNGGVKGVYIMNGGTARFAGLYLGNGYGVFTQYAGEVTCSNIGEFGRKAGGTGIYTVVSGTLSVSNLVRLGASAGSYGMLDVRTNATVTLRSSDGLKALRIGDAGAAPASTGILMLRGGTVNVQHTTTSYIYIGDTVRLDSGSILGWGVLNTPCRIYFGKSARVIADGFGESRALAITGYDSIVSFVNPYNTTNGWYAQNGGRLLLAGIPVTGNGIKYWGGSNSTNLVNAVTLNLAGVTGSGSLTGSLHAADHGDVPAYAAGAEIAGVWNFTADGFTFGASTLSFRYNTLLATNSSGLVEGSMRPYRHNGTAWELLPDFGINTTRKLVIASNVTGFGWFAVAESMTHRAPLVNAGPPQTVNVTDGASLQGYASDDGLPGALTTVWSKHGGPGTVNFGNANVTNTTAGFSVDGTYVLRLTATDSDLSRFSDVEIIVTPASGNIAPVVNAGTNKTVSQKLPVALEGSMSDDGLPDGSLIATWSKVSGPGTVTFADASLTNTAVTFSRDGAYVLELMADDSELTNSDTVSITVTTVGENKYWTQGGADSNWMTSANWSTTGEPTSVDYAYLGHNSYAKHARVTLNQQDAEFSRLYMGHDAGTTGEVVMAGGTLTANHPTVSPVMFVGLSGVGRFIQNGGVVSNLVLGALTPYLSIGHNAGSSGRYELNGGILTGFSHLAPGYSGEGTFIQAPGTTNTCM